MRTRAHTDGHAKQGSISFLKERNKKLLLAWLTRPIPPARTEEEKVSQKSAAWLKPAVDRDADLVKFAAAIAVMREMPVNRGVRTGAAVVAFALFIATNSAHVAFAQGVHAASGNALLSRGWLSPDSLSDRPNGHRRSEQKASI